MLSYRCRCRAPKLLHVQLAALCEFAGEPPIPFNSSVLSGVAALGLAIHRQLTGLRTGVIRSAMGQQQQPACSGGSCEASGLKLSSCVTLRQSMAVSRHQKKRSHSSTL